MIRTDPKFSAGKETSSGMKMTFDRLFGSK